MSEPLGAPRPVPSLHGPFLRVSRGPNTGILIRTNRITSIEFVLPSDNKPLGETVIIADTYHFFVRECPYAIVDLLTKKGDADE